MADKNFWSKKIFWSESIQNGPKRILKRKSQIRKFLVWSDQTHELHMQQEDGAPVCSLGNISANVKGTHTKRILKRKSRFLKFFPIMT